MSLFGSMGLIIFGLIKCIDYLDAKDKRAYDELLDKKLREARDKAKNAWNW